VYPQVATPAISHYFLKEYRDKPLHATTIKFPFTLEQELDTMNTPIALDVSALQLSKSGSRFPTGCKFCVLVTEGHLPYSSSQCLDNPGKEIRAYGLGRRCNHVP